ncbi:benzoate/H(+) symporter BenE family transporter [Rhodococcus sp. PAMC28707]|uniref:benzoate/H(+) symporter BenE family transporter n=1 Tax=unclassified Rhodococcus (in: high G+C Gram-positive bacteria) TaxID=192944 RepID=UPI00109E32D6|nr:MULTISPECIES: benzoate/H(+) symporter BenE family transporter [unclassified Rhodococcus (in: high G+C Gram-positive bacteria)]QCB52135.1 benzoate/H(+) symporter BenE family transporter [Rhodococcus sp. PAMC28705]QCB59697.1 benzoate/H(+) symporter BenE family transporter [Rhodococcus sp. PAMC28707]
MPDHPDIATTPDAGRVQPILAGIVAALVGFTSSFAVVLTGLRAVGATPTEAASGLLAIMITQGVGMVYLSRRYRQPITLAWSTPGAALLAGTGTVVGGWPAAVGAFVVVGVLIVATGLWPRLGKLIQAIPTSLAQAMLAGVLLPLCLQPVTAFAASPAVIAPVVLVWLVLQRFSLRWAVPAAFGAAAIVIAIDVWSQDRIPRALDLIPRIDPTMPHWTWQAIIGIALPLYIVTMASQNIPGAAVMTSFGYDVPWRPVLSITGIGTVLGAPFGGHAINLAAISAALAAGPSAHPDTKRRWIAASSAGWFYLFLALCSAAVATLVAIAPPGVVETVAGLALFGTLGASLAGALKAETGREAAILTFLIAASGVVVFGIGSAFWALVVGLLLRWVLARKPIE